MDGKDSCSIYKIIYVGESVIVCCLFLFFVLYIVYLLVYNVMLFL